MEILKKKCYGMPIWLMAVCLVLIYRAAYMELLPDQDMLTIIIIMFAGRLLLFEIGEHLPIWKDFLGGGYCQLWGEETEPEHMGMGAVTR